MGTDIVINNETLWNTKLHARMYPSATNPQMTHYGSQQGGEACRWLVLDAACRAEQIMEGWVMTRCVSGSTTSGPGPMAKFITYLVCLSTYYYNDPTN